MEDNKSEIIDDRSEVENIVTALDSDIYINDNNTSVLSQEESVTIDDEGVAWYGIKAAARVIDKSDATVRRYVKAGKIRHKIESSPYGDMYLLRKDDVDIIAQDEQMRKMKHTAGRADLSIEMQRFFESYESMILPPLKENILSIKETQDGIQSALESTNQNLDKIVEKNNQLEKTVSEMKEAMEAQQKKIEEQQEYIEAQKKKGFFARLFGKN